MAQLSLLQAELLEKKAGDSIFGAGGQLSVCTGNASLWGSGFDSFRAKCTANRIHEINIALLWAGRASEVLVKSKSQGCFDFALVTALCGSCCISVKRDLASIHQRRSIYPLYFHWNWPSVYAKLLLFLYHWARTFLRASLCNLCSSQRVDEGQGVAFLSWIVREAEEKYSWTPLTYLVFWLVVPLCHYFWAFCPQVLKDLCCEGRFCISWEERVAALLAQDGGAVPRLAGGVCLGSWRWPGACSSEASET